MADEKKKSWLRGAMEKVEAQVDNKKAQASEGAAAAGDVVVEKPFGINTVAVYANGYVRVSKLMTPFTPYEKLKSITFAQATRDQSPGGRAAASALTLGLSSFTSPEDVNLSLTIVTDKKVHTLSNPAASRGDVKAGMALEAAGNAVLGDQTRASETPAAPAAVQPDIAEQIRKLSDLHQAGILTDEEFATKKADLLGRM